MFAFTSFKAKYTSQIYPKIWIITPILMIRCYTTFSSKTSKSRLFDFHSDSKPLQYQHPKLISFTSLPTFSSKILSKLLTTNSAYQFSSTSNFPSKLKILTTNSAIPLSFTIHINDNEKNKQIRETFKPKYSHNYAKAKEMLAKINEFYNYEPVIILHGLLGAKRNFNSFVRLLKSKLIIVMDLRNHGDSHHSIKTSINDMVDDVVYFLDSLSIPKCVITGHSLGGKVAMATALSYPDKITQLISLDMPNSKFELTGENASKSAKFVSDVVNSVFSIFDTDEDLYESRNHIKDKIRKLMPNISMEMLSFLLQNVREKENGKWEWTVNMKAIHQSLESDLFDWPYENIPITYSKPSLFIRGGKSNYVLDKHKPKILEQFPNARFSTILNAGHWIHSEQPIETATVINQFLGYV